MHSMGDNDDEWMLNKDGSKTKIGPNGGDTTDYLYDTDRKLIGSKSVMNLEAGDNMTADYSTMG